MNPGELRHKIEIQKTESIVQDGYPTEVNTSYITWAKVNNLAGRTYYEAKASQSEKTIEFTIRYRKNLLNVNYIVFNSKRYAIEFVDNRGYLNKYITFKAKEVTTI